MGDADEDLQEIGNWLRQLPQPLGLMTCNDVRGLHVLDACSRLGFLVPEQVSVVGVDNEELLCELCNPPLSSVQPNSEQIGYSAAKLLDALMAGRSPGCRRLYVDPIQIVPRRSTEALALEDKGVAAAMRFIHEQAIFGCNVEDVLRETGMSRSVLERKFRQHLKRSPQEEIRVVRLNRVKQLLTETDFTLERIAELSGFEHPEYMSVVFKRMCGLTPGQYRRRHGP
jgi:LacI family transcriptional regulator